MNRLQVITKDRPLMNEIRFLGLEDLRQVKGGWLRPNWPVALLEVFSKSWEFGQDLYHRNCDHE
jgi:hypothetical protein